MLRIVTNYHFCFKITWKCSQNTADVDFTVGCSIRGPEYMHMYIEHASLGEKGENDSRVLNIWSFKTASSHTT